MLNYMPPAPMARMPASCSVRATGARPCDLEPYLGQTRIAEVWVNSEALEDWQAAFDLATLQPPPKETCEILAVSSIAPDARLCAATAISFAGIPSSSSTPSKTRRRSRSESQYVRRRRIVPLRPDLSVRNLAQMPGTKTIVSVYGFEPFRIGGGETLSASSPCCLASVVGRTWSAFRAHPRSALLELRTSPSSHPQRLAVKWQPARDLARILRHRPEILHLQFTVYRPVPLARVRFYGVRRVLFTDQASKPEASSPPRHALQTRRHPHHQSAPDPLPASAITSCAAGPPRRPLRPPLQPHLQPRRFHRCQPDGSAFRQKLGIPDDRQIIVQVSWMIPDKGFDDLLEAAKIVIAQHPAAHFVMVGEGADRQRYIRQTARWGSPIASPGPASSRPTRPGRLQRRRRRLPGLPLGGGFRLRNRRGDGQRPPAGGHPRRRHPRAVRDGVSGYLVDRRDLGDRRPRPRPLATPLSAAAWATPAATSPSATSTPTPTSPNSSKLYGI